MRRVVRPRALARARTGSRAVGRGGSRRIGLSGLRSGAGGSWSPEPSEASRGPAEVARPAVGAVRRRPDARLGHRRCGVLCDLGRGASRHRTGEYLCGPAPFNSASSTAPPETRGRAFCRSGRACAAVRATSTPGSQQVVRLRHPAPGPQRVLRPRPLQGPQLTPRERRRAPAQCRGPSYEPGEVRRRACPRCPHRRRPRGRRQRGASGTRRTRHRRQPRHRRR